ncbi:transferase family-domain-containing protein [Xylaria nigripes]|nr:transferase family-domain-containing protein [Xylaria nigripes]
MPSVSKCQQLDAGSTSSARSSTQNRFFDVVGQFPQLKTYNHGVLIFRLANNASHNDIVTALREALLYIISRIPWLGECVVYEVQDDGTKLCKTAPFPPTVHDKGILIVKDYSNVLPSYEELDRLGAPVSLLDGKLICPVPGFPLSYNETDVAHPPVVILQASFIKNGLLLNFSNQHNMVDGVGIFSFLSCLSIAMQGKEIPQSLIDQANLDRGSVIPLFDPGQSLRDHGHLIRSPNTSNVGSRLASSPRTSRWALFRVLQKKIPAIKLLANKKEEFVDSVKYISTNDALCAFYWKRLAAVRLANKSVDSSSRSKFLRAIDARSAVGVPLGYMGQMVYHAATFFTYHELASPELSLAMVASRIRADLNESNTEWAVRSYATFLAGVSDKSTLLYGGGFDPILDVGNSSMAQLDFTGLDFGILGKAEYLRRPNLSPAPGVMYILPPEGHDRDLPILVCLSDDDIEGLKADDEWGQVTHYVG